MAVSGSVVSGGAQDAPHPALRPHSGKLKAYQGLCKTRGQVLISPHRLGPRQCLQCCCCLVSVAITSDGRALPGRGCETTSLSQFPHARCSTFAAVASLRHKPPILDTRWLGGWPSQVPLPLSVLTTYQFFPVSQGISPAPWVLTHDPCPLGFSLMGSMPLCPNGCG